MLLSIKADSYEMILKSFCSYNLYISSTCYLVMFFACKLPQPINNDLKVIIIKYKISVIFFFSTPLRSAVAARIFLEILFDQKNNFPGTIPDQAFWWAYNYQTNGDEKMFKTIVENFENAHSKKFLVTFIFI